MTDRPTDGPCFSVSSNRPYLASAVMRPKKCQKFKKCLKTQSLATDLTTATILQTAN